MLINATQLAPHLNDPAWVIFDCRHDLVDLDRGSRLYGEGHLPGAHFAAVDEALSGAKTGRNGRHPLPAPADFGAFLSRHGVTPESHVVAYDDAGGLYAARLWWMAKWIGLKAVYLLDGGLPRWVAEGRPVTTAVPPARPAAPLVAKADASLVRDTAAVLSRLEDPASVILDARAVERYRGEKEPMDPVAGHIPGALNRFYKSNLKEDLTFRPPAELRREFTSLLGGRTPQNVTHQCGSGITACANLFAMEYAGLPGSKLYPGSWSEWVADRSRPVAGASLF